MLFPDGTKYMGMWKLGKRHGQGTLTMSDGEKMSGEWRENKEWNITKYDANETSAKSSRCKMHRWFEMGFIEAEAEENGVLSWIQAFGFK